MLAGALETAAAAGSPDGKDHKGGPKRSASHSKKANLSMRATHSERSRKFEPLLLSHAESSQYSPRGGETLAR